MGIIPIWRRSCRRPQASIGYIESSGRSKGMNRNERQQRRCPGMLTWVALVILIGLCLADRASAQSPCEALNWGKCHPTEGQQSDQNATPGQRGTTQQPFAVEVIRTEEDKAKAAHDAKSENEKAEREEQLVHETWAIAVVTFLLFLGTAGLARYTYLLWMETKGLVEEARISGARALEATTAHTQTLFNIERAYLVGGGQVAVAGKTFQIEFSNYGKTPAFIYAFDVEFAATLEEVQAGPQEEFPMFFYEDVVPPGGGTTPQKATPVPITVPKATVAYGAFWYED